MASTESYRDFILDQLSSLDGISCRAMMGEYVLYCQGRIFGGIYDDRFLVKATKSAQRNMPGAQFEAPYPGAKPMLLVDNPEDRDFLAGLVTEMLPELPEPRSKTKR